MATQKEGGVSSLTTYNGEEHAVSDQSLRESLNPPSSGVSKNGTVDFVQPRAIRKDNVVYPNDILLSEEYTLVTHYVPVPRLFIYYNEFIMECDPKTPKMFFSHGVDKKETPPCQTGPDGKKYVQIYRGGQSFESYTSLMVEIMAEEITRVLNGSCSYSKSKYEMKEEGDKEELVFEMEDIEI